MGALHYLFSFRGRINRAKFWAFYLIAFGAEIVVLVVQGALIGSDFDDDDPMRDPRLWATIALVAAFAVPVLYSQLAVTVKRLHDRDRSAWWLAIFYGPTLVTLAVLLALMNFVSDPKFAPFLLATFLPAQICQFWGFVELHLLRGTQGDNRYGPDPLAGPV